MTQTVSLTGRKSTMKAWYTAKSINATKGSRTALDVTLAVGDVVVRDPYDHDARGGANADVPGVPNVTRATTGHLAGMVGVVTAIPSASDGPNSFPDPVNASTQRRGGLIEIATQSDRIKAKVNGGGSGLAIGARLSIADGSLAFVTDAGIGSRAAIDSGVATLLEAVPANTTGLYYVALGR